MGAKKIFIYGAGGFAREVAWLASTLGIEVVAFVDDDPKAHGEIVNGIPVKALEEIPSLYPEASAVIAVGSPRLRQELAEKVRALGLNFQTLIHPSVERSKFLEIGVGTVIAAGSILTTNIHLGNHVQINLDCTVGHDVVMSDYVTLAPGVHISGWVHLGKRVYLGTGAVVINGSADAPLVIDDDVVVGAGAVVTKSLPRGVTAVGVPAKPLRRG